METSTGDFGRLGNQIIRNIAVSFIATKHNLYVNYYNYELIKELGIELFIGDMRYNRATQLTDDNYFLIYNRSQLKKNLDPRESFFQTKPIMDLI